MKRAASVLLCLMVACGGSSDSGADESTPDRVVGLITDVEPADEIEPPTSFTVEEEDGDTYTIQIDPLFNYGFDLLHVREHFVTGDPVEVEVQSQDGDLVATSFKDAD